MGLSGRPDAPSSASFGAAAALLAADALLDPAAPAFAAAVLDCSDLALPNINGKTPRGSRDLRFLKAANATTATIREEPVRADRWSEQEHLCKATLRRDRPNYAALRESAGRQQNVDFGDADAPADRFRHAWSRLCRRRKRTRRGRDPAASPARLLAAGSSQLASSAGGRGPPAAGA